MLISLQLSLPSQTSNLDCSMHLPRSTFRLFLLQVSQTLALSLGTLPSPVVLTHMSGRLGAYLAEI